MAFRGQMGLVIPPKVLGLPPGHILGGHDGEKKTEDILTGSYQAIAVELIWM